jgi:hypothetical protein
MFPTVCFTGARRRDFRAWLGTNLHFQPQTSGDLGTRMREAFGKAFADGAARAVAIGTDVPGLSVDLLSRAAELLADHDVVLGPAGDGGYYLIGMTHHHPELFTAIDWSTDRVARQTRAAIGRLGLTLAELPVLNDVDRPEDLVPLRADPEFADVFHNRPLLSVVIPTLNEAEYLGATLERVLTGEEVEVIVADGGSDDTTRDVAAVAGATVLPVDGGRAAQQNAGAAQAKGRHLLFLHADTLLPEDYEAAVRRALDDPRTVAGAFRFGSSATGLSMRLVEWGTNLRSSFFGWPYGDQGLFIEKRVFNELGGFAPLPIMEDFELVRRLRRRGRVVTVRESVITSARRWQRLGILRTILCNQAVLLGYFAGISPKRLARFYRGTKEDRT